MDTAFDLGTVRDFAIAILLGALVGLEREKRREAGPEPTIGGLRTFLLIALLGAVSAWLSRVQDTPWIFIGMLAIVATFVAAGYVLGARVKAESVGITTEIAALAVFLLAGMTMLGARGLAVGLGIFVAAALAYKQPLHGLVARIGWTELFAVLRLLVATFIVLPLLPNHPIDPLGALNPYKLWLFVILISALSFVGYVATRLLGEVRGIPLTGLTGGLVSLTAVTMTLARRGGKEGSSPQPEALASGILFAWSVMFVRVLGIALVVGAALVPSLLLPFGAMAVASALIAWRLIPSEQSRRKQEQVELRNPFSLIQAARFAAIFAVVLVAVKFVEQRFPAEGLYPVAALAGTTDVDAITLSMAAHFRETGDEVVSATAITIAALINTIVKCGIVAVLGGGRLRRLILVATAVIIAVGSVALFFV